jgi:pimeloyl-ACP methyl ester carboxylesterase
METFRLADGRLLEYLEVGDPDGRPVVLFPGTPATAGLAALYAEAAQRQGVRLVAVSRPGYGDSTTTPPGLVPVVHDVAELLDGLGIGQFEVYGVSGGGPYALAACAALPGRTTHVLVAAGPGPCQQVTPEMLEDGDRQALEELAAGRVEEAVSIATEQAHDAFGALRELPVDEFGEAMRAFAPPGENYLDSRPEKREIFVANFRRALAHYDGYVRDNLSWLGSWDFDLGDVTAPVQLHYGDRDAMVPAVNGEWLAARLPDATFVLHPDAGHGDVTFGLAESLFAALD